MTGTERSRAPSQGWTKRETMWKKLLLLTMGVAMGLVLCELSLRAVRWGQGQPYVPDEHCGTRLMPGFSGWWQREGRAYIRINRYGFRHGDRHPEKRPGTLRVAVLGDSFIEAFQVPDEQTLCEVAERKLASCAVSAGRVVEVLNFGVAGYGTGQQLQMLKHFVWDYQPDVVVLAFFPGNDLRNNSADLEPDPLRPFFRLRDGQLERDDSFREHPVYQHAQSASARGKVWLINRIRLLQLVQDVRSRLAQQKGPIPSLLGAGIDEKAWLEPSDPLLEEAWQVTEQLIVAIHQACRKREVPFLLLVIGSQADLHPEPEVRERLLRQLAADDLRYPERRLQKLARQHGFAVLALAEPMRRYAQAHGQYLHGFANTQPGSGHWNEAGNRLAGQLTAGAICDLLQEVSTATPSTSR